MTRHTVSLIPGDGIGPETTAAMCRVLEALDAPIDWEVVEAGIPALEECGELLPASTLESIRRNGVAIKGPVTTPVAGGFRSVNVALRKTLDLYVNLRPVISLPGAGGRYDDVDIVIVRENSEDLYAGIEFEEGTDAARELIAFCEERTGATIRPDSGISIKPISVTGSRRIVEWAFDYAAAQHRDRVCAVHKANIMKYSDGLFITCAREVAAEHEREGGRVAFDERIVDAFCMNLVTDPSAFDVVVLPNLYGDIVSDLAAGMVGGLGIAPGANIGNGIAVFEPVHGSAPDIAGQDKANPTAQLLSAAMMLDHLGEQERAANLRAAIRTVYAEGAALTGDIARHRGVPAVGTAAFTDAVIAAL